MAPHYLGKENVKDNILLLNRLKFYSTKDNQADIFGAEHWPYVKKQHQQSSKQLKQLLPLMLKYAFSRVVRKELNLDSQALKGFSLAIDPAQGRLLYSLVLANKPNVVIEYGTSFGISSLYIAQALKKNNIGKLYGSEIESEKIDVAKRNLEQCHLESLVDIKQGDVLQTFKSFEHTIDMIFMDGFPKLNYDILKMLEPKMAPGCMIVTDDVYLFGKEMKQYLNYLSTSAMYSHQVINLSDGMAISVLQKEPIFSHNSPIAAEDAAKARQESIAKGLKK